METNKPNVLTKFKSLPLEIKEVLTSVNTTNSIRRIGEKNKLQEDKVKILADETGAVMLGINHPSNFVDNLKNKLGLDEVTVRTIAEDINVEIFRPIRDSLRKIHGISGGEAAPAAPASLAFKKEESQPTSYQLPATGYPPKPQANTIESIKPAIVNGEGLRMEENKEENLDREKVLSEIENPVPMKPVSLAASASIASEQKTENLIQNKLEGLVRMPATKEEIDIKKGKLSVKPTYTADPYREPI